MFRTSLVVVALIAATSSPAFAIGCYERTYSGDHLAKHPRQTIRSIVLTNYPGEAPAQLEPGEFEMRLVVENRSTRRWHARNAVCAAREGRINCGLESDGGTFTLVNGANGAVVLRPQDSLRVGDEDDPFEFGGKSGDDKAFVMPPAACRRAG